MSIFQVAHYRCIRLTNMSRKKRKRPRRRVLQLLLASVLLVCVLSLNDLLTQAGQTGSGTVAPSSTQTSTQTPPSQNPGGFVIRSQVNMVLVDVRVTDKS